MEQYSWFIAVVTPNTEKSCEQKLLKLFSDNPDTQFETYVPVQRELHEWPSTGKRKWVDRVLCPCYLFIRCTPRTRYILASKAQFILHFVTDRSQCNELGRSVMAVIPDNQMLDFQRMVGDAETTVTIDASRLRIGSRVRVKSGRLAGLVGYLIRKPKDKSRLAIRINMLGYASTEFPLELLEEYESAK